MLTERELPIGAYRLLVRFTLLLSIALVVFGIYNLLNGRLALAAGGIVAGVLTLIPSQYYRIRAEPGAENLLVLLTKPECSLCEEAREVVRIAVDGTPFQVQEVNIEDHPPLRRRFKNFIPVLLYQGDDLLRLRFSMEEVRAIIDRILAERGVAPTIEPTASTT
jgi:hypothetical protein